MQAIIRCLIVFSFFSISNLFKFAQGQLPYEVNGEGNGDIRNPLNKFDVPFVPEEFRSSPKRIIFDKNDFVSLLPSSDLRKPLKEAILTVLKSTQNSANDTKVYNDIALIYAGLAKLGGRPGHSAHFAATVKLQICQENMTSCHFEECDLDLDQKDEADPHTYKRVFTLHSKECTRLDSWCYFCQSFDDLDRPIIDGVGCGSLEGLPEKRNCNAEHGDLSVQEQWGCKTTYAIVAGQSEVIDKDCVAIPQDKINAETECKSLDDSDYEVQCICHGGSGCNLHDDPDLVDSIMTAPNDAILAEVNKSIRQLRADLKRVIRRYAKPQQGED